MTNKELAYELYSRYNGDEIQYHHEKCAIELIYHLLQDDKDCDIYPHVAFVMANDIYSHSNYSCRKIYMEEVVKGFECLQNRSEDVDNKLQIARDLILRAEQDAKLYIENILNGVLDKRIAAKISGVENLQKYIPSINAQGVHILDIHVSLDSDHNPAYIDVIIEIEDYEISDKMYYLKIHTEDIKTFYFERENYGMFVFDFQVLQLNNEQDDGLILVNFDEIGYIEAKSITIDEIKSE